MDHWIDAEEEYAIWYLTDDPNYYWVLGSQEYRGSWTSIKIVTYTLENKCPNNEGYVWDWHFYLFGWTATNGVYIKCANEDDFCTSQYPCVTDQGDCDTHDECQDGLRCGSNNCPDSLGYHSEFDCCYAVVVGDEHFCTISHPCAESEGDCDSDDECQFGLLCGSNSTCPVSLGFDSEVDCCYISTVTGKI